MFPFANRHQSVRFESEVTEAESAAAGLQERLNEALRQAGVATAEAEAAKLLTREAEVGYPLPIIQPRPCLT